MLLEVKGGRSVNDPNVGPTWQLIHRSFDSCRDSSLFAKIPK